MHNLEDKNMINQLVQLVENANRQITVQANSTLTVLFWQVGNILNTFILNNKRAEYGKQIVVTVSRELTWSHILAIIPLKTIEERKFYAGLVAEQPMGVRDLRKHISKKTFERTSLAKCKITN